VKYPLFGSMRRMRDRLSAVAAVGLILLPVIALAAEGEAGHAAEHHAPSPWGLIYPFINFAIYSFVLWRYAWPAVRDYLSDRRANTLSALEAAKSVRAEAEALKAEYDAKLRNLEVEAARAREEVLATAQVDARNILDQAQKSADRIRKDSRLVADEEVARARRTLQEETAALVARLAGELVTKQIGPNDQARFVKDFVTQTRSAAIAPGGSR
jgi:F-type H+-transporting ATPase subunit b